MTFLHKFSLGFASILLGASISACNQASTESNTQIPSGNTLSVAKPEPSTVEAKSNQPSLEEAETFIESRLRQLYQPDGKGGFSSWEASDAQLSSTSWKWKEMRVSAGAAAGAVTFEDYSLDPRMLSFPVRVEGTNITFECRQSRCISVSAETHSVIAFQDEPKRAENNEQRATNTWWFSSEEEARRVAKAMNFVLKAYGVKESPF